MLNNITLKRPLAVIDLETTGTDPKKDRIVEISVLKIMPDGERIHRTRRLNPGIPIPAQASAVHGITDADVAAELPFDRIAGGLVDFLEGCDLCGFSIKRFDLRLLHCEFTRVGRTLSLEGRAIIDALEIFHRYERRDLAAAVRMYLGRDHEGGHSAAADVLATAAVLDAMVARYPDLPREVAALHQQFLDPDCVDSDGFFKRIDGGIRLVKGPYRGQPLETVAAENPGFLEWMLGKDFPDDTLGILRDALVRVRFAGRAASRRAITPA